ncbi:MAG TPA: hypothetical protein VN317_05380 [Candidatus Methanoperedens sp.]|nr:hypothetical protein [Candidatus Methanoperedens sp.]
MSKRLRRDARLIALFAILAVLPLAIWACGDAGDGPGAPPAPDPSAYPGATITASVSSSTVGPGDTFTVLAFFKDANGRPVDGMPLAIFAENGGADGYFGYQTNPTLTAANGGASINVTVGADCPEGSYRFVIATYPAAPVNGPQARGYVGIEVSGTAGGTPTVTGITLTTSTPTVTLPNDPVLVATATATPSCTVNFLYQAAGAGLDATFSPSPQPTTGTWLFTLDPTTAGTLTVLVGAYCIETNDGLWSAPVSITVNAAP